jgi:hypothetical protein
MATALLNTGPRWYVTSNADSGATLKGDLRCPDGVQNARFWMGKRLRAFLIAAEARIHAKACDA